MTPGADTLIKEDSCKMENFLFFPASSISQIKEDHFKLTDIYGGIFNFKFPHLAVYLSQAQEKNKIENLNRFGISNQIYEEILSDLLNNKVIYPSKIKKEFPFNKKKVLDQVLRNQFSEPKILNIGDVTLELTQKCPYSCAGCFREINESDLTSISRLEGLIDELSTMGLSKLALSGGEITFSKSAFDRFKHVSQYAKTSGIERIRLLTAGFNPKRVDEALNYLDEIQISVDGLEKTHDSYKGIKGAFRRAVDSLRVCEGSGIKLTTNTVVSQINIEEIPRMIDFLSQFDIDTLRITKIISDNKDLRLNIKNARRLYKLIADKQGEYPHIRIINAYGDCTDILNCTGGLVYAHIGTTGNVFPCDYDIKNIAGNINDSSFQDIWTNSPGIQQYRTIALVNNGCLNCNSRVFCFGNCRIDKNYVKNTKMCENENK